MNHYAARLLAELNPRWVAFSLNGVEKKTKVNFLHPGPAGVLCTDSLNWSAKGLAPYLFTTPGNRPPELVVGQAPTLLSEVLGLF